MRGLSLDGAIYDVTVDRFCGCGLRVDALRWQSIGEQQTVRSEAEVQIDVGQGIGDVQRLLQSRGVATAKQALGLSIKNPDIDYILFYLDKDRSFPVVFYSKTNQAVTSIAFVAWPEGNQLKSTQAWFRAKSISLDSDGGYAVKFLRPLRDDEKPSKRRGSESTSNTIDGDGAKNDDRPETPLRRTKGDANLS